MKSLSFKASHFPQLFANRLPFLKDDTKIYKKHFEIGHKNNGQPAYFSEDWRLAKFKELLRLTIKIWRYTEESNTILFSFFNPRNYLMLKSEDLKTEYRKSGDLKYAFMCCSPKYTTCSNVVFERSTPNYILGRYWS